MDRTFRRIESAVANGKSRPCKGTAADAVLVNDGSVLAAEAGQVRHALQADLHRRATTRQRGLGYAGAALACGPGTAGEGIAGQADAVGLGGAVAAAQTIGDAPIVGAAVRVEPVSHSPLQRASVPAQPRGRQAIFM